MARKKKVAEMFVVGRNMEMSVDRNMEMSVDALVSDVYPSQEEAAQEAADYRGPSYVDGYIVFQLVPVARIAAPAKPPFTLEPIS